MEELVEIHWRLTGRDRNQSARAQEDLALAGRGLLALNNRTVILEFHVDAATIEDPQSDFHASQLVEQRLVLTTGPFAVLRCHDQHPFKASCPKD
ncbi:MAG: hypothetical protein ACRD4B_10240 [Acidobacteriota bacterium]